MSFARERLLVSFSGLCIPVATCESVFERFCRRNCIHSLPYYLRSDTFLLSPATPQVNVGNSSLQYKPVKQNPATPAAAAAPAAAASSSASSGGGSSSSGNGSQLQLIHASPVQLFKFESDGTSRDLGRRGMRSR